ncbi:Disease resistance protein [Nymphaea thermarum]|nr:Disease resistance protein [Nymphaea thermarum]
MQSLSIDTVEEGRNLMKQRLGHKRVLIVLDDIDHHYQLNALIGDHIHQKPEDLFGAGSKIIVTTRDKAERSLISIGNQDEFIMHDQIRDMGRWIVQEEGKHDPQTYSRLWDRKDILEVLKDGSGKDKIQAMVLRPPIHGEEERCIIRHDAFATMSDLRVLHASSCHFGGGHLQLPKNVRWLQLKHTNVESWYMDTAKTTIQDTYSLHNFPLQHPHDRQRMMRQDDECNLEELVVLQLWSCLIPKRILQSTDLDFKRLKVLEVANCLDLVESPNFAHFPSLVKLALDTCINFKEINESIEHLKQLESLRICRASLKKLPSNICQLSSLQSLNLGSCRISSLPERLGNLTALRVLILDNCESLTEVPYSVGDLNQLQHLRLNQCRHLQSLPHLPSSLTILDISNCSAIKRIPDISNLKNLNSLRLEGLGFLVKFDEPIGHLKELEFLSMRNCKNLKELGSTICQLSSIQTLNLKDCKDISALPEKMGDLASLRELNLENCASLSVVPNSVEKLNQLQILNIDACRNLKHLPQLPSSLHILHASNCDNLKIVTDVSSLEDLRILNLDRCWNVVDVPGLENLKSLEYLDLHSCESFGQSFGRRILQVQFLLLNILMENRNRLDHLFPSFIAKFQHLISCTIPGIHEGQYLLFLLPKNVQVCKVGFSLVEEYCIENPEDSMVPSLNVSLQVVADGLEVVFETRRCATHNPSPLFEDEDDCYLIYLKDDEEMQRYLSDGYRMIQETLESPTVTFLAVGSSKNFPLFL